MLWCCVMWGCVVRCGAVRHSYINKRNEKKAYNSLREKERNKKEEDEKHYLTTVINFQWSYYKT
jgi:hypothetical protein